MTQYPNRYPYPPPPYPPRLLCPQCGTELSPAQLSCPRCHRLVHADRLNQLAAAARAAADAGDLSTSLARWEEALRLLPRESRQHATIAARVAEITRTLEENPPPGCSPARWRKKR